VKPAAFDYCRPDSLEEAVRLVSGEQGSAKILAGGQSLGPMLNLRLAQPDVLVDVTGIEVLKVVTEEGDDLRIGACVTHSDVEDLRVPDVTRGLMPHVARKIAYRAIRNRGTIAGSLAHADPAADWIAALSLMQARIAIQGQEARRTLAVEELMMSSFTTRLAPGEVIEAVLVPKLSAKARWGFTKFSRKTGEFAHAMAGVLYDPDREAFRAVIAAIDAAPIVIADARVAFPDGFGAKLHERIDCKAVEALLDARGLQDDYHRQLSLTMLKRAADEASRQ
jgi:aerobic carbon-monoxide dehydrogenase medium subunit